MVKRFEVFMCDESGVQKPCLIISPNEMNDALPNVMIAPITTFERRLPCRLYIGL